MFSNYLHYADCINVVSLCSQDFWFKTFDQESELKNTKNEPAMLVCTFHSNVFAVVEVTATVQCSGRVQW